MKKTISNTQILKKLISFALPLILSGMLQQLFNWVDALIVGNIIGEKALAGIGATTSLYNLFITVIVGFTSGLTVLFARQYGEGNHSDNAGLLARFSVTMTAVFTVIAAFGMIFLETVLKLMDTPAPLLDHAESYLVIVLAAIPFLALYNTYSALLRGMGNSTVPFIAVLISSLTNALLDYVFIVFMGMGVEGAAAATLLSAAAMTAFIIIYTVIKHPEMRFSPFSYSRCRKLSAAGTRYGMPPAVQGSVNSVGNLFLQRFMNSFGEQTVAAITTAYRVDCVLLLPVINFSTAISTLTAQETGAGNRETAERIFRTGTVMMALLSSVLALIILLAGKTLLAMFGLTEESIAIGESFFRRIAVFYIIYGLGMGIKGYLEGKSDLLFSAVAGISALGVRIICSYLFAGIWENMVIAYAEGISWLYLLAVFAIRYKWKTERLF